MRLPQPQPQPQPQPRPQAQAKSLTGLMRKGGVTMAFRGRTRLPLRSSGKVPARRHLHGTDRTVTTPQGAGQGHAPRPTKPLQRPAQHDRRPRAEHNTSDVQCKRHLKSDRPNVERTVPPPRMIKPVRDPSPLIAFRVCRSVQSPVALPSGSSSRTCRPAPHPARSCRALSRGGNLYCCHNDPENRRTPPCPGPRITAVQSITLTRRSRHP